MIEVQVKTEGGPAIEAWLAKGYKLDEPIGQGLGEWASETLDGQLYGSDKYAPPPAGSRYIRTGRLGAGWGLMRHGKTGVKFFNLVDYAAYVVGDGDGNNQAGIHAGRWWLATHRIEAQLEKLAAAISKAIDKVLG